MKSKTKPAPRSLAKIILIRVGPVIVLALALISYLAITVTQTAAERQLKEHLERESDHASSIIIGRLDAIQQALKALAENELIINGVFDYESRANYLPIFFKKLSLPGPENATVILTDYKGRPIIASGNETGGEILAEKTPVWLETVSAGKPFFSVQPEATIVATPVNYSGRPEAALVIRYDGEEVEELFNLQGLFMTEAILGPNDRVLFSTNPDFMKTGAKNNEHSLAGWINLERQLVKYPDITLITAEREEIAFAPVHRLTNILAFSFTAVLLALVGGIWWAATVARKELEAFVEVIDSIGRAEDLGRRVQIRGAQELQNLGLAFNGMLQNLEKTTISRNRVDSILNSMNEMLIVSSATGQVQSCNPAAQAFFEKRGFGDQLPVGTLLRADSYNGNKDLSQFLRLTGFDHQIEATYLLGDSEQTIRWSKSILQDRDLGPMGIIIIGQDISAQVRAARIKDEFISTVSHELRTPLTSINGTLSLLLGGVGGKMEASARDLLVMGQDNAHRLIQLINDLLDLQKLDGGGMRFKMEKTDLLPIINDALIANKGFAEEHGALIILDQEDAELGDAKVVVDGARLIQIITNLLSNACKFSPEGSTVTVRVRRSHAGLVVSVSDQGPGIPDDFKDRIFSRFAQADSTDTRAKGGTGLGLSLVRSMTEKMGGTVWFHDNDDVGTTFFVRLPEAHLDSAEAQVF